MPGQNDYSSLYSTRTDFNHYKAVYSMGSFADARNWYLLKIVTGLKKNTAISNFLHGERLQAIPTKSLSPFFNHIPSSTSENEEDRSDGNRMRQKYLACLIQLQFVLSKMWGKAQIEWSSSTTKAYPTDTSKAAQPSAGLQATENSISVPLQTITKWNDNQTVGTKPTPLRAGQSVSQTIMFPLEIPGTLPNPTPPDIIATLSGGTHVEGPVEANIQTSAADLSLPLWQLDETISEMTPP
ncbi:hypothetical protein L218DRAFT_951636 [Marasmius fiardii PR-910]|nr:hypothetical protein L218DRAFT_951636 [Marasmius fiardii PR-910]